MESQADGRDTTLDLCVARRLYDLYRPQVVAGYSISNRRDAMKITKTVIVSTMVSVVVLANVEALT